MCNLTAEYCFSSAQCLSSFFYLYALQLNITNTQSTLKSVWGNASPGILPLLILVPPPSPPLCHTHLPLLSFCLPSFIICWFSRQGARGTTHSVHFPIPPLLLRAHYVFNDFARDSDSTIFLVVFDRFNLHAFAIEFIAVE